MEVSGNDPKWTLTARMKSMDTGFSFHQIVSECVGIITTNIGMDDKVQRSGLTCKAVGAGGLNYYLHH